MHRPSRGHLVELLWEATERNEDGAWHVPGPVLHRFPHVEDRCALRLGCRKVLKGDLAWFVQENALGRDLGVDVGHVQAFDGVDDLFESGGGEGAGLGEDEHPLTEGHQRGDRRHLGGAGQRLFCFGVDLREDDVGVLFGGCGEDGCELAATVRTRRPRSR